MLEVEQPKIDPDVFVGAKPPYHCSVQLLCSLEECQGEIWVYMGKDGPILTKKEQKKDPYLSLYLY